MDITGPFEILHSQRMRFPKFPTDRFDGDGDGGDGPWGDCTRLPIGDGFIPIDSARARQAEGEEYGRDEGPWHQYRAQQATPTAAASRALVRFIPPRGRNLPFSRGDHHVTAPRRRRPRPCRSAPLVHHPGVSERNIWPGRAGRKLLA